MRFLALNPAKASPQKPTVPIYTLHICSIEGMEALMRSFADALVVMAFAGSHRGRLTAARSFWSLYLMMMCR